MRKKTCMTTTCAVQARASWQLLRKMWTHSTKRLEQETSYTFMVEEIFYSACPVERESIGKKQQGKSASMNTYSQRSQRNEFHRHLEQQNRDWLNAAKDGYEETTEMRPDGDALVKNIEYNEVHVPNCPHCREGFLKPDVVFFGDTVPKNRVALCQSAVENADGILVVGTSLAVHSAFRHIRSANSQGTPIAILNVGETRAEAEGLDNLLKVEAPASDTLNFCVEKLMDRTNSSAEILS